MTLLPERTLVLTVYGDPELLAFMLRLMEPWYWSPGTTEPGIQQGADLVSLTLSALPGRGGFRFSDLTILKSCYNALTGVITDELVKSATPHSVLWEDIERLLPSPVFQYLRDRDKKVAAAYMRAKRAGLKQASKLQPSLFDNGYLRGRERDNE